MNSGICWPAATQEELLHACYSPDAEALQALKAWRSHADPAALDTASQKLLATVFRRWGERPGDPLLYEQGYLSYCDTWKSSQKRLLMALALTRDLQAGGVPALLLKGAALAVRHYCDPGLRSMEDVDLLVPRVQIEDAVAVLLKAGWRSEADRPVADIVRMSRIHHAWHFFRGEDERCDLHWRPVLRCFSPRVEELFWRDAESVSVFGKPARIPCPTDLVFHACAHGLQWSWTPQIRWIPDVLTVLASPIDWGRIEELSAEADMNYRLLRALLYLHDRFATAVPPEILKKLATAGNQERERREYELLQKPCPLGLGDRINWHVTNFRRIRRFDSEWRETFGAIPFIRYLILFSRFALP